MNKEVKQMMIRSIFGLLMIFSLATLSYPYVVANWRECLSTPGCDCTLQGETSSLKPYIVESAGYFLNSHSAYQAFLNRIEMADISGVDPIELKDILSRAVDNMEKARAAYVNVKTMSAKIPPDPLMIAKLAKFDYDSFQVNYELIVPIFEKVKNLLLKGDIAGLDKAVLANMDSILKQLHKVKAILDKTQAPDIARLWRLNQSYAEAQLFSQYISEIIKTNL